MNNLIETSFLHGDKIFVISADNYFILGPIFNGQPKARVRLFYDV